MIGEPKPAGRRWVRQLVRCDRCGSPSFRPYSWTYPGGVTRHIEALAEQLHRRRATTCGCWRRSTRPTARRRSLHRGARPQRLTAPDYLVPLGRTRRLQGQRRRLEPVDHARTAWPRCTASCAPAATTSSTSTSRSRRWSAGWPPTARRLPLVGTFHSYSRSALPNGIANAVGARRVLNRLHVRIAVSEAAAWTGRRCFGGHYRVIPNGVHVDRRARRVRRRRRDGRSAADRVRRPGGRAQGPAAAAARVRGAARAHPDRADGDRPDARGARAAAASTRAACACSARSTTSASTTS